MIIPKRDKTRISNIAAIPFRGGCITSIERALIPHCGYSMIQNMRDMHPGKEQRGGTARKHTTVISGTPKLLSLHQFSKGKRTERHFFAQAADDDIYEATDAPPTVTTGVFGSAVFTGAANSAPASWGNVDDHLIFSNGVDQHQIYAGTANYIKKLVKFSDAAAVANVPTDAYDFTKEVTDGSSASYIELDSLSTYAAATYECLFIYSPVPINRLTWAFMTGKVSDQTAVGTLNYWNGAWTDSTETDGTIITAGKTMSGNGSMTWTHPTDEIPKFMFGLCGYWYQWVTSAALGADVQVNSLTYGSSFSDIENVWDSVPVYAVEARFFDNSATTYALHGTDDIEIDDMVHSAADTEDRVYWNSNDPIIGIYVDVGTTPNTSTTTAISAVKVWTGEGFTSVGTITDGTNGLSNSGWITWAKPPYSTTYYPEPTQFQTSRYYSYWYYFCVSTATVSDNVRISIETMPYFDIGDAGEIGQCNAVWKDRAVYSFDRWPKYGFVSAKDNPLVLNGYDYGILVAGDGRANKWVWAERFKNELVVAQEEKGKEGGCITLFEGRADDPTSFGKLLLSSKIGGLNSKSVTVVDGVLTSTRTDEIIKDLIFWISHEGIMACDGKNITIISDDIQNYFDPAQTECIRRGYDNEHWLNYDSSLNCLRLGLVSGSSATTPNVFPVFDLVDKTWSFDKYAQNFSCMTEVEAASGDIPILQYAGEVTDGYVYRLNTGTNDIHGASPTTTAIDAYATIELDGRALYLWLREMILRMKGQAAGDVTITPYLNGVAQTALTLSMIVRNAGEEFRRHRMGMNYQDSHISLKFQNNVASVSLYLLDVGFDLYAKQGH